jgi:hypothetical protein
MAGTSMLKFLKHEENLIANLKSFLLVPILEKTNFTR